MQTRIRAPKSASTQRPLRAPDPVLPEGQNLASRCEEWTALSAKTPFVPPPNFIRSRNPQSPLYVRELIPNSSKLRQLLQLENVSKQIGGTLLFRSRKITDMKMKTLDAGTILRDQRSSCVYVHSWRPRILDLDR